MKILFFNTIVLISMIITGCSEKILQVKDSEGNLLYNLDGSPVTKTYYVGEFTKNEYSKEAIDSAINLGRGYYLIANKIISRNKDLLTQDQISKLNQIDDYANRVDEVIKIIQEDLR